MKKYSIIFILALLLTACFGESFEQTNLTETLNGNLVSPVDPSLFLTEGLVGEITEEACTLSGGTETTCYRFSVLSEPLDHMAGPWCPAHIDDEAEVTGIWPDNGVFYNVDGEFISNLATFYDDDEWNLVNDDGSIRFTDSAEACAAAARPDVDEAYQNHCVQCLLSYVGEGAVMTYIIPVSPAVLDTPTGINNSVVGVAFNGVNFDPPAPQDAILSAHTIAPFDDCGGHVNLHSGYHYHAHTGCTTEISQEDAHAPMIGYAMDGFPMYALLDENGEPATGLDACNGQIDDVRGYHYHVAAAETNSFLGCFQAEYGCTFEGDGAGQTCDASARRGPGG